MRHLSHIFRRLFNNVPIITHYAQTRTMSTTKIAVCQMTSIQDKAANLNTVQKLISDAAQEKVQMIFFPEACDYIADNKKDVVANSEPILTGNIVTNYRELAAKHGVWLSMGGVHELDEKDPSKMYNTHVIINNKGEIVQTYRKLHLFNVEIPEKNLRLKESDFSHPGSHIVSPVDTPIGKIGMSICYDMRFPELSTALSILNADILTYPSAFTYTTGLAHWHVLLRCRAIENQCFVIAAAQAGQHNAKRRSYGHALIVDPWGEVLVDLGEESPSFGVAEISQEKLKNVRQNMPVFQHRRKDIYSLHALSLRQDLLPEHNSATPAATETRIDNLSDHEPCNVFGHVRIPESCVFYKSKLSYAFVNLRCVIPGHVLLSTSIPEQPDLLFKMFRLDDSN
ncbi:carbon-nitrogen hydrolase domain-containing protein [Phthorimaea operculella]|nr:carbon-nitrogen hydrolase domain-containing protein [Phthorimaea operculella]